MTSLRGTGVSPGDRGGPALVVEHEAGPVFRLSLTPDEARARGRAARAGARRLGGPARGDQGAAVARGGGAARLHLRRPPADAARPAAARAGGRGGAAGVGERRVGAAHGVGEPARALQRVQRRVPARAQHRPRRRDRPDPAQPARLARGAVARAAARARGAGRGRPAALGGGRARLGQGAGDRDRRGLVDLPHRDHRALARDPGGGGPQGGDAAHPAGRHGGRRRGARRGGGRAVAGSARGAARGAGAAPARGRAPARHARPRRVHARRRRRAPRGQRRVPGGGRDRAALRGPGHRPLPLRVPARPRPALPDGGAAARRLPPPAGADAPVPGHGPDLGRGRRGARPRRPVEPEPRARRAGAAAAAPLRGALPRAAAGAAARRHARADPGHVPVRERRLRPARGARRSSSR